MRDPTLMRCPNALQWWWRICVYVRWMYVTVSRWPWTSSKCVRIGVLELECVPCSMRSQSHPDLLSKYATMLMTDPRWWQYKVCNGVVFDTVNGRNCTLVIVLFNKRQYHDSPVLIFVEYMERCRVGSARAVGSLYWRAPECETVICVSYNIIRSCLTWMHCPNTLQRW